MSGLLKELTGLPFSWNPGSERRRRTIKGTLRWVEKGRGQYTTLPMLGHGQL